MRSLFKKALIIAFACCLFLPTSALAAPKARLSKNNLVLTRNNSFTLKIKNKKSKPTWSSQNKKVATVSKKALSKRKKQARQKLLPA